MKYINVNTSILGFAIVASVALLAVVSPRPVSAQSQPQIWDIRSIDTMKQSRDEARDRRSDTAFDQEIDAQLKDIKDMGANYVALGTPYDEEFLPYLNRWVTVARKYHLKVWYRGSFSGYEGWFDYPKNVSPDQLLIKSQTLIATHPELFEDGDIFDACPECENAGYWPQPRSDQKYNAFIQQKQEVLTTAFSKIGKKVYVGYPSIIGGRAKDVLKQPTFDLLNNVITIDHYHKNPMDYIAYIEYFASKGNTRVLFGELGAPIPDIHGSMTEAQQASFIRQVFENLYRGKEQVVGVNYWVYNNGTTALVDSKRRHKPVVDVIKDYYQPGNIQGKIINSLGDTISNSQFEIKDLVTVVAADGTFELAVPAGEYEITVNNPDYFLVSVPLKLQRNESQSLTLTLVPRQKSIIYQVRERYQHYLLVPMLSWFNH